MRTESELRIAFDQVTWYVDGPDGKGGRVHKQEFATQMNVLGALAMLEWVLGGEREGNPVPPMLRDIVTMRHGPDRN